MNVAIHDYAGHPFQLDLSKKLSEIFANTFHIYTNSSGGPKAGFESNLANNLEIIELNVGNVEKLNFIKRFFQEVKYGKKLVGKLKTISVDVLVSANTPLPAQFQLYRYCKKNNIKFIFWLQDIISLAAKDVLAEKLGFIGKIIARILRIIEVSILKGSNFVISIAKEFEPILKQWNVKEDKIITIPNWSPINDIPIKTKKNKFSVIYNLDMSFNIIYSGTMGFKHNPQLIYDSAKILKGDKDIKFVIISEGQGADYLKELQKKEYLENIIILPFQKWELFPDVLGSADILLTLLEKNAGVFSVPSKVWSGYCSARPSLLIVPPDNLAAKITKRINAGVVIESYNPEDIANSILELKNNNEKAREMGLNARKYAEENFQINNIAQKFIKIINDC